MELWLTRQTDADYATVGGNQKDGVREEVWYRDALQIKLDEMHVYQLLLDFILKHSWHNLKL